MVRLGPSERPLYIIAPNMAMCHRAALAHGLNPERMDNVRCITSAYALRGTRAGTPFITFERQSWVKAMQTVFELDQAIDLLVRAGRLRLAARDDLEAVRGERVEAAE